MKGITLHPLRLAALDRMSVLRVPMNHIGNSTHYGQLLSDWTLSSHPQQFIEGDALWRWRGRGRPQTGDWVWLLQTEVDDNATFPLRPPYAPGDYFVRETWRAVWCSGSKERGYLVGIEYKSTWNGHRDPQGKTATLQKMHYCGNLTKNGTVCWKSPVTMPEWAARYIVTLGPPVPCRLGDVNVSAMQKEGIFASLMQDPCDMAKQIKDKYRDEWNTIYPRHPYSPDLWTWGYPVEVKSK